MQAILGTKTPSQVAIIVKDIEASKRAYAAFWGVEVPPTVGGGDYAVTKTEYFGEPAPDANCKMAFFSLGNIQFEIIEPSSAQSTWRDFLQQHGEGLHHMAYQVKDIYQSMEEMKKAGYTLTQFGFYGGGNGAYAYFDCTKDLACFVELLCSF